MSAVEHIAYTSHHNYHQRSETRHYRTGKTNENKVTYSMKYNATIFASIVCIFRILFYLSLHFYVFIFPSIAFVYYVFQKKRKNICILYSSSHVTFVFTFKINVHVFIYLCLLSILCLNSLLVLHITYYWLFSGSQESNKWLYIEGSHWNRLSVLK